VSTQNRINRELAKTGRSGYSVSPEAKVKWKRLRDMRRRHPVLLAIEGWYEAEIGLDAIPEYYRKLLAGWDKKTKPTRWLLRNGLITDQQASEIGGSLKLGETVRFKLSARHKDIVRVAESRHYRSCFGLHGSKDGWRGTQQLRYLVDPDMGIIYVPDAGGDYLWRAFVRLVQLPDKPGHGLVVYRTYGNSEEQTILSRLDEIIPVYRPYKYSLQEPSELGYRSPIKLYSASRCANPVISKAVWSDHRCLLDETRQRLFMDCVRYSV